MRSSQASTALADYCDWPGLQQVFRLERQRIDKRTGEQFIIKKEVYRMIREAFQENGIEFANRNVTVTMPPALQPRASGTGEPSGAADPIFQAGAAAALALIQEEEQQKAALEAKPKKE